MANSPNIKIKPIKSKEKAKTIPISKIKSGVKKSLLLKRALVAYIDVLGFAQRKSENDVKAIMVDFPGPLVIVAHDYPKIIFKVFSDNAFVIADITDAKDFLRALRTAFVCWSADGILVRGGIAIGTYNEYWTAGLDIAPSNFTGYLFSGSAINKAVKLENSQSGAFLFIDKSTARFFSKMYKEPIFKFGKGFAIAWSDDKNTLHWYTGISLLRLQKFLEGGLDESKPIIQKLTNNVKYSLVQERSGYIASLVLALLSLPEITDDVRSKICSLIGLKKEHFVSYKKIIQLWLKQKDKIRFLKALAESDSAIPKKKVSTRNLDS